MADARRMPSAFARTPVLEHHDRQLRRLGTWGRVGGAAIVLVLVVVAARIVQLQAAPDPRLAEVVGRPFSKSSELIRRGSITDRRGRPLAVSTVGHRLFIDAAGVEDARTIALDLAALIGADPTEIDRALQARPDGRFIVIRDVLEDWQTEAIRAADLPGVGLEERLVRHPLHGTVASRLVGRVGFEHAGLSGIEHRFDSRMQGRSGTLTYLRDARRRPLWVAPSGYRPGTPGGDVRMSIDLVVQAFVEQRLDEEVDRVNAGGGRVVVLDTATGEILAIHDVIRARPERTEPITDPLRAVDPALGRNRCATDPYEPGSTFKPFVWAAALERERVTMDETLPTPASGVHRTSFGRRIVDVHPQEDATWRDVLVRSLNSGMLIVAERMSHAEMQQTLRLFGFGVRTGCGLPGESKGLVTDAGAWSAYTQTSVAMGYEIAVTPIQMVRAFSAFCRDGTIPLPRLTAQEGGFTVIRRAIMPHTAITTRQALRDVMDFPSKRKLQSQRYTIFGKSGTAMLARRAGGGYHPDRYVSSFIGGAPYDDPRVAVLCVIDDPDRSIAHFGSAVAGPVVRDVIDFTLEYLAVPPDRGLDDAAAEPVALR